MPNQGERVLRRAVRVRVVLRYLGELAFVLGVTGLVPALGAILFGEFTLALPYGGLAAVLIGLGLLARRAPNPEEILQSEALVVTVAAFVVGPVAMTFPLVFQGLPWLDALFEAISGFTTTGLSTLESVEGRSRTFLLARAWMQWVGGLGFVVLTLALIFGSGLAARRLGTPGLERADVRGSMRAHARRVLVIYLALSALGWSVLVALGARGFDALVHTLAGVSTGGFAPRDASLAELGSQIQWGILGLSLLGAISLPLYGEFADGRWRRFRDDSEARSLLVLIALLAAWLFWTTRFGSGSQEQGASDLVLLAVSAQTTAGFSTFGLTELSDAGKAIVIVSMLTGGCVGSTAGGIKLLRVLLVTRLLYWLVGRTGLPTHAVSWPTLAGERLESDEILRAAALILLFVGVVLASWVAFLVCGYAPLEALFEVTSAVGTVGLSVGLVRPDLEPALKGVLCLDMLLGRLEIFAVLVALSPRTWIGRRAG